ncbi:MAG: adenylate/guanylate cyclase domain-containing protein [Planctomycetota bacterium]|nr:adenylate/guanylate cyclase domain-containing protein [Planctomycetota bacterium]
MALNLNSQETEFPRNRLTLEYPGDLEKDYQEYIFADHVMPTASLIYGLLAGTLIAGTVIDYLVVPDVFSTALALRFGLVLPIWTLNFVLTFTRLHQKLRFTMSLFQVLSFSALVIYLGHISNTPGSVCYVTMPSLLALAGPVAHRFCTKEAFAISGGVLCLYLACEVLFLDSPLTVRNYFVFIFVVGWAWGTYFAWSADGNLRTTFEQRLIIERERARSESLLLNILPETIAHRLKAGTHVIADSFQEATVLFADIVGFTPLSDKLAPESVVEVLNELFSEFDSLTDSYQLEKIKTIGDAYMVAAGVPVKVEDHAPRAVALAVEMQKAVRRFSATRGVPLDIRIGVSTGPVVAGVIGVNKFHYDLWGDTVNTAARMESHGVPGAIHITGSTFDMLHGEYQATSRGEIQIKGKGTMPTWLIEVGDGLV